MLKNIDLINTWLKNHGVKNYTIHDDLTVDVNGDVDLSNQSLTAIPIQFGEVKGYFSCSENELTNLKGSPHTVEDFFCASNQLKTLDFAPRNVVNSFTCSFNQLTSLKGSPKKINGHFDCSKNPIKTLFHKCEKEQKITLFKDLYKKEGSSLELLLSKTLIDERIQAIKEKNYFEKTISFSTTPKKVKL